MAGSRSHLACAEIRLQLCSADCAPFAGFMDMATLNGGEMMTCHA